MLVEMRIRDLGVIAESVLDFDPGFTVVTGETGAGKTMVVTGLSLLLGARADAALVRAGASHAGVEGRFRLPPGHPVLARAAAAGAELDEDGTLLVARTVSADGRSRAFLGGRSVPLGVLGELAGDLAALHGQAGQQALVRPGVQRAALDRYAGPVLAEHLAAYRAAYERHRELGRELAELTERARERAREADMLRHGLAEVRAADPRAGEDAELATELARLSHADALRVAALGARAALSGDDGPGGGDVLGLLAQARQELRGQEGRDPALDAIGGRLAEAGYLLADVAADLASYAQQVDADPARLQAVHERVRALRGLQRKYGEDMAAVLAWADDAQQRLADLDGADERVQTLRGEHVRVTAGLAGLAERVSDLRREAAGRFAADVTAELAGLALPSARLQVDVRRRPAPDGLEVGGQTVGYGASGVDEVELLFCSHPSSPAGPLSKVASGGELSRVMLAIEVVFAGADPVPTFVFDEVDAGVGGRAAAEVGTRLARLSGSAQVIAVTHLPQVAAYADRQLVVTRDDDGAVVRSGVRSVSDDERVAELARMLAGLQDSSHGRGHARELLAAAAGARSSAVRHTQA